MDIVVQDTQVWVINFYSSTKVKECQTQFQEMRQYIIQGSTLIVGDFNSVLKSSDRLLGKTDGSTTAFHNLLHRHGLIECQHDRMYTFQNYSNLSQQSRINYIVGHDHIMSQSYQYQQ